MNDKELKNKGLVLIPKLEDYIEYIINIIVKLPRTEKFNIGNEIKLSIYSTLENAMYLLKINRRENKKEVLQLLNKIDANLNCQRIFLRIMKKQNWIDEKKFNTAINKIFEIGKIVGGLVKIYAKNN